MGTKDINAYLVKNESEDGGAGGDFHLPSIIPPLSILFHIKPVRDILIDPDHDVGFIRAKTEDGERTRERADRFLEWGGSRPLNIPSEPVRQRVSGRDRSWTPGRNVLPVTIVTIGEEDELDLARGIKGHFRSTYLRSPYEWKNEDP